MATFEVDRDYPLAQILEQSEGSWIVYGLIKALSSCEALILLCPSEKGSGEVEFPSSEVCLVRFYVDNTSFEGETVYQRLCSITTLWVLVTTNEVATPIRVVPRPISFLRDRHGRFTLTIPMEPSLSTDEWHRLGMNYIAVVTINEDDCRYVRSEQDVEGLYHYIKKLPSFWLHASRFEGDELDVSVDANGAVVDYLDIKRAVKLISLSQSSVKKDIVRQRIEALPHMELETQRRHLIPLEKALDILRSFLKKGEPADMVSWPVDE